MLLKIFGRQGACDVKCGFVSAIPDYILHFVGRTLEDVRPNGTHSKIDQTLDGMLRNYPKVDMGKSEKTAAN
jgi:hypothetical protein